METVLLVGGICLVVGFAAGSIWGKYLIKSIVREVAEAVGLELRKQG